MKVSSFKHGFFLVQLFNYRAVGYQQVPCVTSEHLGYYIRLVVIVILCISVFCLREYPFTTHHRRPEDVLGPQELELQMIASHHGGGWESNLLLSHLCKSNYFIFKNMNSFLMCVYWWCVSTHSTGMSVEVRRQNYGILAPFTFTSVLEWNSGHQDCWVLSSPQKWWVSYISYMPISAEIWRYVFHLEDWQISLTLSVKSYNELHHCCLVFFLFFYFYLILLILLIIFYVNINIIFYFSNLYLTLWIQLYLKLVGSLGKIQICCNHSTSVFLLLGLQKGLLHIDASLLFNSLKLLYLNLDIPITCKKWFKFFHWCCLCYRSLSKTLSTFHTHKVT